MQIEIEEEGALYIASVLRDYESHDAGARAVAEAIEEYFAARE